MRSRRLPVLRPDLLVTRTVLAAALAAGALLAGGAANACEVSQCTPATGTVCHAIGGCQVRHCFLFSNGEEYCIPS